jgi:hypothetical protein
MSTNVNVINLTIDIFKSFNKENVEYVIYKNYQDFPETGMDIDVMINPEHRTKALGLIKIEAQKSKWQFVIMDTNHGSHIPGFNAVAIKLYQFDDLNKEIHFLQIEFFSGFYTSKSILYSAIDLLTNRQLFKSIYIPEYSKQTVILLFTLHNNLTHYKIVDPEKNLSTKQKILSYYEKDKIKITSQISKKMGVFGIKAMSQIQKGNDRLFLKFASLGKLYFLAKECLFNPRKVYCIIKVKKVWDEQRVTDPKSGVQYSYVLSSDVAIQLTKYLTSRKLFRESLIIDDNKTAENVKIIKKTMGRGNFVLCTNSANNSTAIDIYEHAKNVIKEYGFRQDVIHSEV